jgi:hypothetical protein
MVPERDRDNAFVRNLTSVQCGRKMFPVCCSKENGGCNVVVRGHRTVIDHSDECRRLKAQSKVDENASWAPLTKTNNLDDCLNKF